MASSVKMMNHLGRCWISSLSSCATRVRSGDGLLSHKMLYNDFNSSALAFLNRLLSTASPPTGKNWFLRTPGPFLSPDSPSCNFPPFSLGWEACAICPCSREYGRDSQYSLQTRLRSSASAAWLKKADTIIIALWKTHTDKNNIQLCTKITNKSRSQKTRSL